MESSKPAFAGISGALSPPWGSEGNVGNFYLNGNYRKLSPTGRIVIARYRFRFRIAGSSSY